MLQNRPLDLPHAPILIGGDLDSAPLKPRLLIVDDDPEFITMCKIILHQAGFHVSGVTSGIAALEHCKMIRPDVILLDLMMPGMDGYATCRALQDFSAVPIVVISAAPREDNLFRSLELGAEDYLSKPFNNNELIARLKKAVRRAQDHASPGVLSFPGIGLQVDLDAHEVTLAGKRVSLRPTEFSLLSILASHAPRNVWYGRLTSQLWGQDSPRTRSNLKRVMFNLRRKLEVDPVHPRLLVNNRGVGYQLLPQP